MYTIRGKKLDSTTATLKNIRKQKDLKQELLEIDKRWSFILKEITKQKLDLMDEVDKLDLYQRQREHFNHRTTRWQLRNCVEKERERFLKSRESRRMKKWEFKPNPFDKVPLHLPPVNPDETGAPTLYSVTFKNNVTRLPILKRWGSDSNIADSKTSKISKKHKTTFGSTESLPDLGRWDRWEKQGRKNVLELERETADPSTLLVQENHPIKKAHASKIKHLTPPRIVLPPIEEN